MDLIQIKLYDGNIYMIRIYLKIIELVIVLTLLEDSDLYLDIIRHKRYRKSH